MSKDRIVFYNADYCPFAHRTYLALLEKEPDPYHPVHFELKHVAPFKRGDPVAEELWKLNPAGTVPTIAHHGKGFGESLLINEYVDEVLEHKTRPLLPPTAAGRYLARLKIERNKGVIDNFYPLLRAQTKEEQAAAAKKLEAVLKSFNDDIDGPYLLGEQYTLADIAFVPFFERLDLLGGHYRNFVIPAELTKLHTWIKTTRARPSFTISTAPRGPESMAVLPYENRERGPFLIEVSEGAASDLFMEAKEAMKKNGLKPGVRNVSKAEIQELSRQKQAAAKAKLNAPVRRGMLIGALGTLASVLALGAAFRFAQKNKLSSRL